MVQTNNHTTNTNHNYKNKQHTRTTFTNDRQPQETTNTQQDTPTPRVGPNHQPPNFGQKWIAKNWTGQSRPLPTDRPPRWTLAQRGRSRHQGPRLRKPSRWEISEVPEVDAIKRSLKMAQEVARERPVAELVKETVHVCRGWRRSRQRPHPLRQTRMLDFGQFDFGQFDFGQFDFGQLACSVSSSSSSSSSFFFFFLLPFFFFFFFFFFSSYSYFLFVLFLCLSPRERR